MEYQVKLTTPAENDAYESYEYLREISQESADKWLVALFEAIFSLDTMPRRCPVISESEELGFEARQLLYGKRSGTYRILFDIKEESEDVSIVRVLRIWHSSKDKIRVEDLELSDE